MKAKSLLPGITYTEEEEEEVHDLEHKLLLYKMMAEAVGKVRPLYGKSPLHLRRHSHLTAIRVFVGDKRISPSLLQSIASMTLLSFVVPKTLVKVAVEQALRMENVIEKLLKRVGEAKVISLQSMTVGASTIEEQKKLLIVNFIALLELLRTGAIEANQHGDTGEIHIQAIESALAPTGS
jgi:chromatin segregation and condensation protein Rec8/ScpA/Scc1 (kleisin family)